MTKTYRMKTKLIFGLLFLLTVLGVQAQENANTRQARKMFASTRRRAPSGTRARRASTHRVPASRGTMV